MRTERTERWTWRDRLYHRLTGRVPTRFYVQRMMQLERDRFERDLRRNGGVAER